MTRTHDAVIIGGGPAGATAALLLARAGWSVALIERKTFPRRKVCGEYISATNLPLFDRLGVGERFRDLAGGPVRKVALFAGQTMTDAALPRPDGDDWGRALARDHLDTWLIEQARAEGAEVLQPCSVDDLRSEGDMWRAALRKEPTATRPITRTLTRHGSSEMSLHSPIIVAAHGSWEPGSLPTQSARPAADPTDLLAFKAHFHDSDLPDGWMPLLAFPGGYGGMVHTDGGRVSLSCCIRREQLTRLRARHSGTAGDAVLAHIQESCLGVRRALASARRDGAWLAAGPIRPGVRLRAPLGIFPIGNAAGESHPVIAEGISMAIQSAWLLAAQLVAWRTQSGRRGDLARVAQRYGQAWRRAFLPRLHASRVLAEWAMRPAAVAGVLPMLRLFPSTMTWIARLTGKAQLIMD